MRECDSHVHEEGEGIFHIIIIHGEFIFRLRFRLGHFLVSRVDLLKPALGLFLVVGIFVWVPEQTLTLFVQNMTLCPALSAGWHAYHLRARFLYAFLMVSSSASGCSPDTSVHCVVQVAYSTMASCASPQRQARRMLLPYSASPLRVVRSIATKLSCQRLQRRIKFFVRY